MTWESAKHISFSELNPFRFISPCCLSVFSMCVMYLCCLTIITRVVTGHWPLFQRAPVFSFFSPMLVRQSLWCNFERVRYFNLRLTKGDLIMPKYEKIYVETFFSCTHFFFCYCLRWFLEREKVRTVKWSSFCCCFMFICSTLIIYYYSVCTGSCCEHTSWDKAEWSALVEALSHVLISCFHVFWPHEMWPTNASSFAFFPVQGVFFFLPFSTAKSLLRGCAKRNIFKACSFYNCNNWCGHTPIIYILT